MLVAREGEDAGPQIAGTYLAQWLADAIITQISDQTLVTESSLAASFFQHEEGDDQDHTHSGLRDTLTKLPIKPSQSFLLFEQIRELTRWIRVMCCPWLARSRVGFIPF
jgi:hypothetical protein